MVSKVERDRQPGLLQARRGSLVGAHRRAQEPDPLACRGDLRHHAEELQALLAARGHRFSIGALWRFFARHNIHLEKKTAHASEQDRPDIVKRRVAWFDSQLDLDPEKLVFIDETWATRNIARKNGRALRGERLRASVPHGHVWTPVQRKRKLCAGVRVIGCCHVSDL